MCLDANWKNLFQYDISSCTIAFGAGTQGWNVAWGDKYSEKFVGTKILSHDGMWLYMGFEIMTRFIAHFDTDMTTFHSSLLHIH
jgi:hypothetical protein